MANTDPGIFTWICLEQEKNPSSNIFQNFKLTCSSEVLYSLQYVCIVSTGTVYSIAKQYSTVLVLILVLTTLYCVAILANTVLDMQLSYKGEKHLPTTPHHNTHLLLKLKKSFDFKDKVRVKCYTLFL